MRALLALLLLAGLAAIPAASAASTDAAAPCYGVVLGSGLTGACLMDPNCRGPDGSPGIGTYQGGRNTGCVYF